MKLSCSFCGRSKGDVGLLISGIDAHICEDCIEQGHEILIQENMKKKSGKDFEVQLMRPIEIKEKLDQYVIGQDKAKRILSVAVYTHYKRLNYAPEKQLGCRD